MIIRCIQAGLPAGWVTADEVYGVDPDLRAQLEALQLGYVLGIGCNRRVTVHGARGGVRMRADQIAADLGDHCWSRYSAGPDAKGPRFYDWAFVALHPDDGPAHRWLLIRRHPDHGELAYYRCGRTTPTCRPAPRARCDPTMHACPARGALPAAPTRRGADRAGRSSPADSGFDPASRRPGPAQPDAALPARRRGRGTGRWAGPGAGHCGRGRGAAGLLLHPTATQHRRRRPQRSGGRGRVRPRRRRRQLGCRPGGPPP